MTLTGSDTWFTPGCEIGAEETFTEDMQTMASDFDIPFNCAAYPVCTSADFNKQISGVDQDDRSFTSTFTYNRQTNELTYIKSVPAENASWTEVITISRL